MGFLLLLLGIPLLALAGPRKLEIDLGASSVTFDVRATMHSFTGTTEGWTAEIDLRDAGTIPDAARFSLDLVGMKTGNPKRDKEMLHWMGYEEFPTISFTLTNLVAESDAYQATGDLTLHGQTKPITFPVVVTQAGESITFAGEVEIDHREYGLKQFRKLGFLTVAPVVKVAFKVTGKIQ